MRAVKQLWSDFRPDSRYAGEGESEQLDGLHMGEQNQSQKRSGAHQIAISPLVNCLSSQVSAAARQSGSRSSQKITRATTALGLNLHLSRPELEHNMRSSKVGREIALVEPVAWPTSKTSVDTKTRHKRAIKTERVGAAERRLFSAKARPAKPLAYLQTVAPTWTSFIDLYLRARSTRFHRRTQKVMVRPSSSSCSSSSSSPAGSDLMRLLI